MFHEAKISRSRSQGSDWNLQTGATDYEITQKARNMSWAGEEAAPRTEGWSDGWKNTSVEKDKKKVGKKRTMEGDGTVEMLGQEAGRPEKRRADGPKSCRG